MWGSVGRSTAIFHYNTAKSSLTIGIKILNMNKRIGLVQV